MIIIDTREDFEFAESHIDGAVNLPPAAFMGGQLPVELEDVDRDEELIVYCRSGSRSNVVAHLLRLQGFTAITNGINEGRVRQLLEIERN